MSQSNWPQGLRIAMHGKLGAMSRQDAFRIVRNHNGIPVERGTTGADIIVLGADAESDVAAHLDLDTRTAIGTGRIELLQETEFWQRLGVDKDSSSHLYTPRMLADLVEVSLRNVRRWIRLGLLSPVRVNHRLPYFDFEGLQSARQIKQWTDAGISPDSIVKQLRALLENIPKDAQEESFDRWNIYLDGQSLLVRYADAFIDATNQLRIDFDSLDGQRLEPNEVVDEESEPTISIAAFQALQVSESAGLEELDKAELLRLAEQAEDEGNLADAVEWFRVLLTRYGPQPEANFALAELLYRLGDVTAARERYYMSLELDEDFVEARANLGCVLVETGRLDIGIAAFQGALMQNEEFPDVHYHLARALDDAKRPQEAAVHWQRFLELAPNSPWAAEAIDRLQQ